MNPSKKHIRTGEPLQQKDLVQSIFKFMNLRSVFSLSRVCQDWKKFLYSPGFHPVRVNFYYSENTRIKFEDDKEVFWKNIQDSRIEVVAKIVDCIIFEGDCSLDISPALFSNVKELALTKEISDDNEEFFIALAPQAEYLELATNEFSEESLETFLRNAHFPKVEAINFGWFSQKTLHLDYKENFPRLRMVMVAAGEYQFPRRLDHFEILYIMAGDNVRNPIINPEIMQNLKHVIMNVFCLNEEERRDKKSEISAQLESFIHDLNHTVKLHILESLGNVCDVMELAKSF